MNYNVLIQVLTWCGPWGSRWRDEALCEPHWPWNHTYWRNPGCDGLSPIGSWQLSRVLDSALGLQVGKKPHKGKTRPGSWSTGWPGTPGSATQWLRPGFPELWGLFPHWTDGEARLSELHGSYDLRCMVLRISSAWWPMWKNRASTKDPTASCSFILPQGLGSTTGKKPNPFSLLSAHRCPYLICAMLAMPARIQEHPRFVLCILQRLASWLHLRRHKPRLSPLRSGPPAPSHFPPETSLLEQLWLLLWWSWAWPQITSSCLSPNLQAWEGSLEYFLSILQTPTVSSWMSSHMVNTWIK